MTYSARRFSSRTCALLALAVTMCLAFAAFSAASAKADATCNWGEFCLWDNVYQSGNPYDFSGNDQNLANDYFVSGKVVSDNSLTLLNAGWSSDVWVYEHKYFGGAQLCVPNGANWDGWDLFVKGWAKRISSYHWTRSC